MNKYLTLFVLFFFASSVISQENSPCVNWTAYKDEKCYKFFNHLTSYSEAGSYCAQQGKDSTVVVIKTKDEQDAIVKLLKASGVADNVWIGINKTDGVFKNIDQTELNYNNWADNRPMVNITGLDCVDMSTDESNYGKWFDEKCQKRNALVCQKIQTWSVTRLQNILLETRRELAERVLRLEKNPVPIGFIFVQFINQTEPKELWPNTEWQNISPKSAGQFFRVEGGQAAQFGQIQESQTQSIVLMHKRTSSNEKIVDTPLTVTNDDQCVYTGGDNGEYVYLHIRHGVEEIRPINSAIRIWKRVK